MTDDQIELLRLLLNLTTLKVYWKDDEKLIRITSLQMDHVETGESWKYVEQTPEPVAWFQGGCISLWNTDPREFVIIGEGKFNS